MARSELVPVLVDEVGAVTSVSLVWQPTEFMPPKLRAFIDLAAEVMGEIVADRDAER